MATASARLDHSVGNLRAVTATLTTIADAETWDSGLGTILHVSITPTTAAAGEEIGCTVSGGTVTFAMESGDVIASVMAFGY